MLKVKREFVGETGNSSQLDWQPWDENKLSANCMGEEGLTRDVEPEPEIFRMAADGARNF